MLVKIHRSYRDVVAICDSELIGKKFEQENFQIDIRENFFGGEELSEEKLISVIKKMAREDATFNIIGKNSTNAALKAGILKKEGIKEIQGIQFAMVLL